jgi:hypothetical protein
MALKRMPFISAVQLARVDGSTIIPTIMYYQDKKPLIGREALELCPTPELLVEDFKLEIGRSDPDNLVKRNPIAENTPRRTPIGIAKDFLDESIKKISNWLALNGLVLPNRILIAEPLSLGGTELADESWLAFYRKAIRKALHGKFQEIDFLPEPFAVFQYYRYGLRHPLVSEQRKHVALVLDFGGGTFDVSVVETTKAGDIREGGVNSRPLGARSIQVGGFYINRLIAEELLFSALDKVIEKATIRKALTFFYESRNADEDFIDKLSDSQRAFFRQMKDLLHTVESAKISICNSIANWSLTANLAGVTPYSVNIPTDPFKAKSQRAFVKLDADKLREIYINKVWTTRLRDSVITTLDRAEKELNGQSITVVLLSGGSSNIKWLRPLIDRDLKRRLMNAQIIELSENFQEIVAKGLATECARRYYTGGQGDFRAVTYNRLCLLLCSDDGELESKQFYPLSPQLNQNIKDVDSNVLLPSASSLRGLIGQRLEWKVKLARLPKRTLNYYFMRSSFDPADLDARHNIVEARVFTPSGTQFQQNIIVELIVREDGTAEPRFIYGKNNMREGTVAVGKPFYIDMTFATEEVAGETYLGFDFGTSTSACSYVSSGDITWIEERSRTADWLELSELVLDLPYPAAAPLAKYMSEMDPHRRSERGREAVEAMLTFMAFVALAELSSDQKPTSSLFKGMQHRSAGPLWGLLKQAVQMAKSQHRLLQYCSALVKANSVQIDQWVSDLANPKHGKTATVDFVTFLTLIGNNINKILELWKFGIFEGVTPKRFSHGQFKGIFRILKGSSQTFINVLEYQGSSVFATEDVYLINAKDGTALSISPLYVWGLEQAISNRTENDLFEYDSAKQGKYIFKSVQSGSVVEVDNQAAFSEIYELLHKMREKEQPRNYHQGLTFISSE